MNDPRPVKRCVCADVTFLEVWEAGVRTLEDAQERFGCGLWCESCVPYLIRMVETGETEFEII